MSSKLSLSPILVFWFFVIFGPQYFWFANVEHTPYRGIMGMDAEIDKVSILTTTGLSWLMLIGGAVGLYKKVTREGAVAPLKITLAAVCSSFFLLAGRITSGLRPDSFLAHFYERRSFICVVFMAIFSVATIALLAVALREQRSVKSTNAGE